VKRGEVIALVGHNGSGKTTLAKLLAGLYAPNAGTIRWNGVDRSELPLDSVRRSVGMVFQDFMRYELPVSDNVGFGDVQRLSDHAGIDGAIHRAGAGEIVAKLPKGLGTRLSRSYEEGVELSGGQWQRLALARAFFRDAEVLVLDEPSAALDPIAERALFEDLRELCAGRTVIMISHRFSTVRSADRIIVLEDGHLVEEGDHETLLAKRGRYATLFEMQAAPYST
jgi:ATP-binding cassette subfamily B protein